MVRRFDRITVDGKLRTLAVEDGSQIADRPPADNYLLSAERTFAVLISVCDAPRLAGRELAFAYVTGRRCARQNASVLQGLTGEWKISPAYDLPSSYFYSDTTMALRIAGRGGDEFSAADFIGLSSLLGVPGRATRRLLSDLVAFVDGCRPGSTSYRSMAVRSRNSAA